MERRLAAILAADVVGYTRLMGADEAGTLARLKALRGEVIDPEIAAHNGRLVKLMGDGALVEFASVVDAVACAVAIQREMAARDEDMPEDRRITFRIGINLGDVIVDGDDIYGDGVNIAARLEGLAEPGGICVSRTVFNHVKGKVDFGFDDLGEQEVKNIPEPVRIFKVLLDAPAAEHTAATAPAAKPVIALAADRSRARGAGDCGGARPLATALGAARGTGLGRSHGLPPARPALNRRAAVHQHVGRPEPGLFRRRHDRGPDH